PTAAKSFDRKRLLERAFPPHLRDALPAAGGLAVAGLLATALGARPATDSLAVLLAGQGVALAAVIGAVGAGLLAQHQFTARALLADSKEISGEAAELLRQMDLATARPTFTADEAAARADLEASVRNYRARPVRALVTALNTLDDYWLRWDLMVSANESEMLPETGLHLITGHWISEVKEQLDRTWLALEVGAGTVAALAALGAGLRRTVALTWLLGALITSALLATSVAALALPLTLAGGYLTFVGIRSAALALLADTRAFGYEEDVL
ncbi:MAG: hypothetical protein NTZ05_10920, partial [Chloroflexi bacterium]|nr:hypothetical protein [Chloroflexota bacterium]